MMAAAAVKAWVLSLMRDASLENAKTICEIGNALKKA
jgi:hypothetical protein